MLFQSTHPRGVRLHAPDGRDGFFSVSIHAPAWGATANISQAESVCRVSIHAPAWGATGAGNIIINNDEVFQSTHPRGVRHQSSSLLSKSASCFNPRTRVGCDTRFCKHITHIEKVSIHAPAWGATCTTRSIAISCYVSIHAPAWGATRRLASTCPGGIRFNPRTRVGCDPWSRKELNRQQVSIHAPAWGATGAGLGYIPQDEVFQSTHPRGVRPRAVLELCRGIEVSIHAPAWGATGRSEIMPKTLCGFQSTHPRGVRRSRHYPS